MRHVRLVRVILLLACISFPAAMQAQDVALMQGTVSYYNVFQGQGLSAPRTGATIAAAVANAASANKMIFLPPGAAFVISANLTIPADRQLWIPGGTTLSVNSGVTLTMLAPYHCENVPCFTGAGTVFGYGEDGKINVTHFGAKADGVASVAATTAAIQMAIRSIPGDTGTFVNDKGSGCLLFPPPPTPTGYYAVNATLDFSEKWHLCLESPSRIFIGRVSSRPALIKWHGAINQPVLLFHMVIGLDLQGISVDCQDVAGTVGFQFGKLGVAPSLVKQGGGRHLAAVHCDRGMHLGDSVGGGQDIATLHFDTVRLAFNASAGVFQNSGNADVSFTNLETESNGAAPTGGRPGANVEINGGQLHLYHYTGGGGCPGCGPKPVTADIYAAAGGVQVYGAWSDTHGPFVKCDAGQNNTSVLTGIRHFEGGMTDADTPSSIIWQCNHQLVVDGLFFGDIVVNTGNNSLVYDLGVQFIRGAPHTGSPPKLSTFTGTAITNTYAYAGFQGHVQHGRLILGKPATAGTDPIGEDAFHVPFYQVTAPDLMSSEALCSDNTSGMGCGTRGYQYSAAEMFSTGNAYRTPTGVFKSIAAGPVSLLTTMGLSTGFFSVRRDTATAPAQALLSPGTIVLEASVVNAGTSATHFLTVGGHHIGWCSGPPTTTAPQTGDTWKQGDVCFNVSATSGQPSGWQCAQATCTQASHWKASANVP